MGEKLVESIISERTACGEFTTFTDFCGRMVREGLNVKACEALIKSGALDCLGNNRAEMLAAYEQIITQSQINARNNIEGQLDLFGMGDTPSPKEDEIIISRPELDRRILLDYEQEVTGMYLSGHPLDPYLAYAETMGAVTASQLAEPQENGLKNDSPVCMLLRVTECRAYRTKNGAMMGFAKGEDITGAAEFIVFPALYESASFLLRPGKAVFIMGRVTIKDDDPPQVVADSVEDGSSLIRSCLGRDICIKATSADRELIDKIRQLAERYSDSTGQRLVIFLSDKRITMSLKNAQRVRLCEELLTELRNTAGSSNVRSMKKTAGKGSL